MKNLKKDITYIGIMLIIGIICGSAYSKITTYKNTENTMKQSGKNTEILGGGIKYNLTDNKGNKITDIEKIDLENNTIKININIGNYEKNKILQYKVIILVDSKQIEFNYEDKKNVKNTDLIVNKYGNNTFGISIDNVKFKPKEIFVLLLNRYENQKNICLNLSTENLEEIDSQMQEIDNKSIKRGLYFNSFYKQNELNTVDVIFAKEKDELTIPILFKNEEINKQFKIFLFNGYEQREINDKDFISLNCNNDNLKEGNITIKNIIKGENKYILVAIPIDKHNYERYFSNRITIIGE